MATLVINTWASGHPVTSTTPASVFVALDPETRVGDGRVVWVWAFQKEPGWRRSRN